VRAGDSILARVTASRQGKVISTGQVLALFWGPGSDQGGPPDHEIALVFDPHSRRWLAEIGTGGWPPGLWRMAAVAADGDSRGSLPDPVAFTLDA
jgi:hypothetical protein